jgi:hypothetical protein
LIFMMICFNVFDDCFNHNRCILYDGFKP